jgi:hypothetical protein
VVLRSQSVTSRCARELDAGEAGGGHGFGEAGTRRGELRLGREVIGLRARADFEQELLDPRDLREPRGGALERGGARVRRREGGERAVDRLAGSSSACANAPGRCRWRRRRGRRDCRSPPSQSESRAEAGVPVGDLIMPVAANPWSAPTTLSSGK